MTASFRLLEELYADHEARRIWSADSTVRAWLAVEAGLARAQARVGIITAEDADAIEAACDPEGISLDEIWEVARNVGYPILGLVRAITRRLPPGPDGRVHYGATTQDIMDSGLALQLVVSCRHLETRVCQIGSALAEQVARHERTVMAARTHGQQAVPTTYGAKLATYLRQMTDCLERLREARIRVGIVSLHGAGGTNAAMTPHGHDVRRELATLLGLESSDVPWHVTRHRLVELAQACAVVAAVCVRFAREVVDLSRNEIAEVAEQAGHHRGASSTMPQKANPISAESIVGFGIAAQAEAAGLVRTIEAGHERSAGEWQAEWLLLPQLIEHTASALGLMDELVRTLVVDEAAMRRNLRVDGGLLMSEAMMMRLAPVLGREQSHDVVYTAAHASRASGRAFADEITTTLQARGLAEDLVGPARPEDYLGETGRACRAALAYWAAVADAERTEA